MSSGHLYIRFGEVWEGCFRYTWNGTLEPISPHWKLQVLPLEPGLQITSLGGPTNGPRELHHLKF